MLKTKNHAIDKVNSLLKWYYIIRGAINMSFMDKAKDAVEKFKNSDNEQVKM